MEAYHDDLSDPRAFHISQLRKRTVIFFLQNFDRFLRQGCAKGLEVIKARIQVHEFKLQPKR
jgi:hypothetical protein